MGEQKVKNNLKVGDLVRIMTQEEIYNNCPRENRNYNSLENFITRTKEWYRMYHAEKATKIWKVIEITSGTLYDSIYIRHRGVTDFYPHDFLKFIGRSNERRND